MAASDNLKRRVTNNAPPDSDDLSEISAQIQTSTHTYFSPKKHSTAQETFKLCVSSWNVGGISPPDTLDLEELLDGQSSAADIYVFGFQEIVPLTAGNILAPENGSSVSMKWNSLIAAALNKTMVTEERLQKAEVGEIQRIYPLKRHSSFNSNSPDFHCIISKQMVGLYVTVWVRKELHDCVSHPSVSCVGCGILGRLGNKGAVSVRFCLHETSICFVCSHLASGGKENDKRQRNTDAAQILQRTFFHAEALQNLPSKILDHEVIWLGDLNYRIHLPEPTTRFLVKNKQWSLLLEHDQLKAELNKGHIFEGWNEKEIDFAPTYKYNQNSDDYYGTSPIIKAKGKRTPAWCDRIIWYGEGLKQIQYNRGESRLSDHRPVRAIFMANVEVSRPIEALGSTLMKQFIDL